MNVLYATDGSRPSAEAGELLTRFRWADGDRAVVLSVVPHHIFHTGRIDSELSGPRNEILDEETRAAKEYAETADRMLEPFFPRVESRVHAGYPSREILNAAGEIGADLIVMGSHGRSGLTEWFLGSVSRSVLERAACSVLIGRPDVGPLSQPLLAYDGSPESEAALNFVARLPLPDGAKVMVVRVADPVQVPASGVLLTGLADAGSASLLDMLHEESRKEAEQQADRAAQVLSDRGIPVETRVRTGEVVEEIADAVQEWGADLVVSGAHSRGGWVKDLLGNTARGILQRCAPSVLIARSGTAQPLTTWDKAWATDKPDAGSG